MKTVQKYGQFSQKSSGKLAREWCAWLRKYPAIASVAVLGTGLVACEPKVSSAPLVAGEMVGVRGYPENASRAAASVFKFQCENVQQVKIQVLRVQAGNAETMTDLQYERPEGNVSSDCLVPVSYKYAEEGDYTEEEAAQATFVFSDRLTIANGQTIPAVSTSSRPGFANAGSGSSSGYLSEGFVVNSTRPEILYWQLEYPSQPGRIMAVAFSSIQEMESFSRSHEEAKVWAVLVQPTE